MPEDRPGYAGRPTIGDMDDRFRRTAAIMALLRLPKASWPEVAATVLDRGDPLDVLAERLDDDGALFSVGESADTMLKAAAAELTAWAADRIDVHSCLDEAYPGQLRDIHQAPPLLFTRGRLAPTRGRSQWSAPEKPHRKGLPPPLPSHGIWPLPE